MSRIRLGQARREFDAAAARLDDAIDDGAPADQVAALRRAAAAASANLQAAEDALTS